MRLRRKGYAAHWRYKGQQADSRLDQWIGQIREVIEGGEDSALEFVDELKLDLFNEEVYVFTPNGDLIVLAKGRPHWTSLSGCTPRWAEVHWSQGQQEAGAHWSRLGERRSD